MDDMPGWKMELRRRLRALRERIASADGNKAGSSGGARSVAAPARGPARATA